MKFICIGERIQVMCTSLSIMSMSKPELKKDGRGEKGFT